MTFNDDYGDDDFDEGAVSVSGKVQAVGPYAVLVVPDGWASSEGAWLPFSRCQGLGTAKVGDHVDVIVPRWLAEKEGL